jgi:hypothetical protein
MRKSRFFAVFAFKKSASRRQRRPIPKLSGIIILARRYKG